MSNLGRTAFGRLLRFVRPSAAIAARQAEWSIIASVDDLRPEPTVGLIDVAVRACARAAALDLSAVDSLLSTEDDRRFLRTWPGEHYRLLPALAESVGARLAIEIGTYRGLGALSLAQSCERVVTYDVLDVRQDPLSAFHQLAPDEVGVELRMGNLADPVCFAQETALLAEAQLIFCDGPKDGRFEPAFLRRLLPVLERSGGLLVVDDIRTLPMIGLWRELAIPKLDLTSFGHWSGTGVAAYR